MFNFIDSVRVLRDRKTKAAIGIEWINDDGTRNRYYPKDLNEDWFLCYVDDVRRSENLERKERYHTEYSIDDCIYEGSLFADNETPAYLLNLKEEEKRIDSFMTTLTDVQRRRLQMKMDNPDLSLRKLSASENVSKNAFAKTFNQIKSKYMSFIATL